MIQAPATVTHKIIAPGDRGTAETAEAMAQLIREGAMWPGLRPVALRIVEGVPDRDYKAQALAVYDFMANNMRFVNDPYGIETLQSVPYLVEQMAAGNAWGDCDDFTVMFCALFKVLGFPVKIRRVKFKGLSQFSHVIPMAYIRGAGWYEFDATIPAGEVPSLPRVAVADTEVK